MTITLERRGRRHYLRGQTYSIKDRLRAAGCRWDAAEKSWWTGKRETAESLRDALAATETPSNGGDGDRAPRDGDQSIVAGRAGYKGRAYYLAGRDTSGSRWEESVDPVTTRDGAKYLLYFRDGSRQFWAAADLVEVVKRYDRPQTIAGLRAYADRMRGLSADEREQERIDRDLRRRGEACPCSHGECRCGSDAPCCMCD